MFDPTSALCLDRSSHASLLVTMEDSYVDLLNIIPKDDALDAIPSQARLPVEFKHINKRRKRNLQGFP